MSIDKSKMAVDSSFGFLNLRKQHTNLKLKFPFKIEHKTTLTEQYRSTKTSYDRPDSDRKRPNRDRSGSGRHYTLSRLTRFRSPTTRLYKPTTDTETRQNCLRN